MKKHNSWIPFLLAILLLLSACGEAQQESAPSAAPVETSEPTPEPTPRILLSESAAGLQITELMPANRSYLPDGEGAVRDWIELQNTGEHEIRLDGLYLSDSAKEPLRYPLPAGTLAPGAYLLLFCGGEDGAPFSLNREGEELLLSGSDGSLLQTVRYSEVEPNCSVCFRDGEAYSLPFATPGYPNTEQGYEDFLQQSDRHGALVISEIVSYNTDFNSIMNQRGKYYDWIELQNVSEQPVELGEYYLSDSEKAPEKSRLAQQTLEPGETVLIYCSGDISLSTKGYCHVDFKLHTGETVWLRHETEGLSDLVYLPGMPGTGSYGRLPGESGFFYFETRSPGVENREGLRLVSRSPAPDLPQGIYENAQGLSLRLEGPGEIRYTLDGSLPDRDSSLFTDPIPIEKSTVVRARSFEEGRHPSPCVTLSYIVNEGHTLPVVSLVCDGREFQDLNTYIQDVDREIPADAVFLEGPGAEPLFESGCSLKLHGASSRKFAKKSYKLVFHDRYGGDVRCDPFQRGEERDYHALLLRGGTVAHMYIVKDSLTALTALEVTEEPLTLDVRYCVVYVNAEYYGIYALREAYSERYAVEHTGSTEGNVLIETNRGAHVRPEIYETLRSGHMRDEQEYAAFCETFDVDAFATWLALEAYFKNEDPDGNIRFIRGDGTGGKWTAALFDLDISIDTNYGDYSYFFSPQSEIAIIAANLLPNAQFREALLRNAARLYHNGLGADLTRQLLQELTSQLDGEMERNCERWWESTYTWEQGKENLYLRLGNQRTLAWIRSLQQITKASDEEIESWFGDLSSLY